MINYKYAERRYQKLLLAADIPFEQLAKLPSNFPIRKIFLLAPILNDIIPINHLQAIYLVISPAWIWKCMAKWDLKKYSKITLKGKMDKKLKTINSFGRNLSETEVKKALPGKIFTTTLISDCKPLWKKFSLKSLWALLLLWIPQDGGIVALLSRPNFDPALFLEPIQEDDWRTLQEKQPFLNRAFNACYPPGSIFKLVTVSAMLGNKYYSAR